MSRLAGLLRRARHEDGGAVGLMLAVLTLGLLGMVGLVVDGAVKARAPAVRRGGARGGGPRRDRAAVAGAPYRPEGVSAVLGDQVRLVQ